MLDDIKVVNFHGMHRHNRYWQAWTGITLREMGFARGIRMQKDHAIDDYIRREDGTTDCLARNGRLDSECPAFRNKTDFAVTKWDGHTIVYCPYTRGRMEGDRDTRQETTKETKAKQALTRKRASKQCL